MYGAGSVTALPLSPAGASAAAARSVQQAAVSVGLSDLTLDAVTVAGPDVAVTVSAHAVLPLAGLVAGSPGGVLITVTATARSAVAR